MTDHQPPTLSSGDHRCDKSIHLGHIPVPPNVRGIWHSNTQLHTSILLLEVLVGIQTADGGRDYLPSHLDHPCDARIWDVVNHHLFAYWHGFGM